MAVNQTRTKEDVRVVCDVHPDRRCTRLHATVPSESMPKVGQSHDVTSTLPASVVPFVEEPLQSPKSFRLLM